MYNINQFKIVIVKKLYCLIPAILLICGCSGTEKTHEENSEEISNAEDLPETDSVSENSVIELPPREAQPDSLRTNSKSPARSDDEKMEAMGFVDVTSVAPDVVVSLPYATPDNFTGVKLYETLTKAYLHPLAAKSLSAAQKELSNIRPGYRIKIYDASRPMSAQKRMYKVVQGTPMAPYVGNPKNGGGLHNYGMAVDATIVDAQGKELDMGTKFDHLGKEANIDKEELFIKQGILTPDQVDNRKLLRKVMTAGGFTPLKSEWWHFNKCTRNYAKAHYPLINF